MIQSPGFTVFHDVCDSFQTCGRSQEPVISSGSRKASSPLGVLPTNALTSATLSPVHWTASTSTGFLRNLRAVIRAPRRSEEHTSELQSRENLVCRLLLEKKKPNG